MPLFSQLVIAYVWRNFFSNNKQTNRQTTMMMITITIAITMTSEKVNGGKKKTTKTKYYDE